MGCSGARLMPDPQANVGLRTIHTAGHRFERSRGQRQVPRDVEHCGPPSGPWLAQGTELLFGHLTQGRPQHFLPSNRSRDTVLPPPGGVRGALTDRLRTAARPTRSDQAQASADPLSYGGLHRTNSEALTATPIFVPVGRRATPPPCEESLHQNPRRRFTPSVIRLRRFLAHANFRWRQPTRAYLRNHVSEGESYGPQEHR